MIPKIIHQTWKTHDVPKHWKKAFDSCKRHNPDFQHILWSHDEMDQFVITHFAWLYPTWIEYPHMIQRCDSFRYMVLYAYGGIYMDLDIGCKRPLHNVIHNQEMILANSPNVKNNLTNSFIASSKQNEFMRFCVMHLVSYKNMNYNFGLTGKHMHVMYSTGPKFIDNMYYQYIFNTNNVHKIHILSQEHFSGDCSECNKKCNGGELFFHLKGNSWNSWDSVIWNILLCNYRFNQMTVVYAIIMIMLLYIKI